MGQRSPLAAVAKGRIGWGTLASEDDAKMMYANLPEGGRFEGGVAVFLSPSCSRHLGQIAFDAPQPNPPT